MSKRLIVLFDGSGNSAAEDYDNPTNVFRRASRSLFGDQVPKSFSTPLGSAQEEIGGRPSLAVVSTKF